ncbi:MAG: hypothetical protein ACPGYL_10780, partial [Rhodospirillaceae bacterium]
MNRKANPTPPASVAILGADGAGLGAARALAKDSLSSTLFEVDPTHCGLRSRWATPQPLKAWSGPALLEDLQAWRDSLSSDANPVLIPTRTDSALTLIEALPNLAERFTYKVGDLERAKAFLHPDGFRDQIRSLLGKDAAAAQLLPADGSPMGPDSQSYVCVLYLTPQDQLPLSFVARRLRRWPVGTGPTSAALPAEAEDARALKALTQSLFQKTGMVGWLSLSFQKRPKDGAFLMEAATVGLLPLEAELAALNGCPLVRYGVAEQTGRPLPKATAPFKGLDLTGTGGQRSWRVDLATDLKALADPKAEPPSLHGVAMV